MSDPADLEHQIKLDYEMMLDDPSFDVNRLAEQDMQHPSFGASPFGWPMPAIPQDNPFAEGSHCIILTVNPRSSRDAAAVTIPELLQHHELDLFDRAQRLMGTSSLLHLNLSRTYHYNTELIHGLHRLPPPKKPPKLGYKTRRRTWKWTRIAQRDEDKEKQLKPLFDAMKIRTNSQTGERRPEIDDDNHKQRHPIDTDVHLHKLSDICCKQCLHDDTIRWVPHCPRVRCNLLQSIQYQQPPTIIAQNKDCPPAQYSSA